MKIDDINDLIEETEKINKNYKKTIINRKKQRILKKRKMQRNKILSLSLTASLVLALNLYNAEIKDVINIYRKNNLKISETTINNINLNLEERLNIEVEDDNQEQYLLLNAILENNELNEEDRKKISQILISIIKIDPYIDKETAYFSLLNLKIIHTNRLFFKKKTVEGEYVFLDIPLIPINNIYIYDELKDTVLEHELIHCLLMNEQNIYAPYFLQEGITELLTTEFFGKNPFITTECYPFEVLAVKMLCEILSPDTVLKAYTSGNMNYIYAPLSEIAPDIKAKEFIKDLNDILKNRKTVNKEYKEYSYKINIINQKLEKFFILSRNKELNQKNYKIFKYYIKLFSSLGEEIPYNRYLEVIEKYGYIEKIYFRTNLKGNIKTLKRVK